MKATQDSTHAERWILVGVLDEDAPYERILAGEGPLRLDLRAVARTTSVGVRDWAVFLRRALETRAGVVLEACSPAMVKQFGMIPTSLQSAEVESVMLPFYCEACDEEREVFHELSRGTDVPEASCDVCGEALDFDEVPAAFFSFLDDARLDLLAGESKV